MKKLLSILLFVTVFHIAGAQTGTITGSIVVPDENNGAIVNIGLKGTVKGAVTDLSGHYIIRNIAPGTYTLQATHIGLKKKEVNVKVASGQVTRVPEIRLQKSNKEIGEVVVTGNYYSDYVTDVPSAALRIETPLLEAPQNIQVITRDVLEDQQSIDMLESVTRNTSGAQMIEHWGNFARINMRGFKLPAFRNGMNVDLPWGPLTEDMSIVDRIEFVKGPAGFMLSSGEPGGFYNVVTKKPRKNKKNEVSMMVGSFNTLRATADLGGELSKDGRLLYRLNLMGMEKNSHRDYDYNNRFTVAPSLSYQFDARTKLTAEYILQYSQMIVGGAYVFSPDGMGTLPRNFTLAEPNLGPTNIWEQNLFLNFQRKLNQNWKLTAQLGYLHYKQIGSSLWPDSVTEAGLIYRGLSSWDALSTAKLGQVYLNGDLKTGKIAHHILVGLDMGNKEYFADWFQHGALGNTPLDIHNPVHYVPTSQIPVFDRSQSIRKRAYNGSYPGSQLVRYSALYGQDEVRFFSDKLRLTLAGRFTTYHTSVYGAGTDDRVFTPRAGVSYSIDKNTSVYGLFDQAFIPEAGTDKNGKAFKPVRGNDWEAGVKREWGAGRWKSSLIFYKITKENVLTTDPSDINYQIQLGEAQSKGVEFDLQGEILTGLNVILNYANTDLKVTKDSDPSVVGTRLAGHAKHMTNGWLKYQFKNSGLKGLGLSLGYQYQIGRSSWNWGADNESILPDYFRLDGAVSWKNDAFTVALNVNNLLDKYLYSGSGYASFYYWQTEPGINYRLSVRYRF